MRIELDTEADALYLEIRDGEVDSTLQIEDGVHIDLDKNNHPLGMEFVTFASFEDFLRRHGGRIETPDIVEDRNSLRLSPTY